MNRVIGSNGLGDNGCKLCHNGNELYGRNELDDSNELDDNGCKLGHN